MFEFDLDVSKETDPNEEAAYFYYQPGLSGLIREPSALDPNKPALALEVQRPERFHGQLIRIDQEQNISVYADRSHFDAQRRVDEEFDFPFASLLKKKGYVLEHKGVVNPVYKQPLVTQTARIALANKIIPALYLYRGADPLDPNRKPEATVEELLEATAGLFDLLVPETIDGAGKVDTFTDLRNARAQTVAASREDQARGKGRRP